MSQTVTLRLPDQAANWLKHSARQAGRSVNEFGATVVEEARRASEFAEIEFRPFGGQRQACMKGQLPVWQVIAVAEGYGMDPEKTAAHFEWPAWRVRAAMNYYDAFREEIDLLIADNRAVGAEELGRRFPRMRIVEVEIPAVAKRPSEARR